MRGSQRLDVALGGTLLVTGLLEIAVGRTEFRPIPAVVAVLVGAAALLLRSKRPVLCLAVFVAVAVFTQLPGIADALTASVAVGCLLALGSVGRRSSDPISITAATATIAIFTIGSAFGSLWPGVDARAGSSLRWNGRSRARLRRRLRGAS